MGCLIQTEYIVAKRRIQKKTLIALAEEIVLMPVILKIVMYNETNNIKDTLVCSSLLCLYRRSYFFLVKSN